MHAVKTVLRLGLFFTLLGLMFVQSSYSCPVEKIVHAVVVDQDCKNFNNWKSSQYKDLTLKLKIKAESECRKSSMSAIINYIYESVSCEESILSGDAKYNCLW